MKSIVFTLSVLSLLAGCSDNGTEPTLRGIEISFTEGFHDDSLVVLRDGKVMIRCRAYSDSLLVTVGCVFLATEGVHKITLLMPLIRIRTEIYVPLLQGEGAVIDTYFDRQRRVITYRIKEAHWQQYGGPVGIGRTGVYAMAAQKVLSNSRHEDSLDCLKEQTGRYLVTSNFLVRTNPSPAFMRYR